MGQVHEEVWTAIRGRALLEQGDRVVVAVSGGLDSMVLLRLLDAWAIEQRWSLVVAHFNHGLRGRDADRDESLVQRTALRLGWPCVCGWGGECLRERRRGVSIEMAAREARHAFLAEVARQSGAGKIALGHHADDQVETVLLRLGRGAGGIGLGGMRWLGPSPANPSLRIVRPLLGQTRAALRAYARQAKIVWREDRSNASDDMVRNWLRRELVPRLRHKFGPGWGTAVARTAEIVGTEADFVAALATRWIRAGRRAQFSGLHPALQRRVLAQQLLDLGIEPGFDLIESLRSQPGERRTIGPGQWVRRDDQGSVDVGRNSEIRGFNPEQRSVQLRGRTGQIVFAGARITWRVREQAGRERVVPRPQQECFDADRVGPRIRLRHWQPGDRFQPIGQRVAIKLQDLFVNARVPREERHRRALAATDSGEIFWVEGLRIAEGFKITSGTRRWLEWGWSHAALEPTGQPESP